MKSFKVIIAGGRDFEDYDLLKSNCDYYLQNKLKEGNLRIISGCAKGADKLAIKYAFERKLPVDEFPSKWIDDQGQFHRNAGYIRNCDMADNADALIAFWNGESKGTKHMIDIANSKGLAVRVIKYNKL